MIDPKRLLAMAKKWQRLVEKKQKRISFPRRNGKALRSTVAKQGCFVVYMVDGERFELPLEYLRSNIFVELFRMSEVEFGLPSGGPITLPCESCALEYVVSFVKEGQYLVEDLEKALLTSICNYVCHTSTSLLCHDLRQTCYNQKLILGF